MNWFTRLFSRRANSIIGQRYHAWYYTEWGRARVEGEVVEEREGELWLDPSVPERQEFRQFVRVWKHDARPVGVASPEVGPEEGT
jgi:hypothetical protein